MTGVVTPPGCFTPGQITMELYRRAGAMNLQGPGYESNYYGGFVPERGYSIDIDMPIKPSCIMPEPFDNPYGPVEQAADKVKRDMEAYDNMIKTLPESRRNRW